MFQHPQELIHKLEARIQFRELLQTIQIQV